MGTSKDKEDIQYLPFPPTKVTPATPPAEPPPPQLPPEKPPLRDWESDSPESRLRDPAYIAPCLAAFCGLVFGFLLFAVLDKKYHSSAYFQLIGGMLPFQFFALGAALLSLVPQFRLLGFWETLDIRPNPCPLSTHIKAVLKKLLVLFPSLILVNFLCFIILEKCGVSMQPQEIGTMLMQNAEDPLFLALSCFTTVVTAPVAEEILFRLVLFRSARALAPRWAMFLTCLAFALVHASPQFIVGLALLAWQLQNCRRQGGLLRAILLHAAYNATSIIQLYIMA